MKLRKRLLIVIGIFLFIAMFPADTYATEIEVSIESSTKAYIYNGLVNWTFEDGWGTSAISDLKSYSWTDGYGGIDPNKVGTWLSITQIIYQSPFYTYVTEGNDYVLWHIFSDQTFRSVDIDRGNIGSGYTPTNRYTNERAWYSGTAIPYEDADNVGLETSWFMVEDETTTTEVWEIVFVNQSKCTGHLGVSGTTTTAP